MAALRALLVELSVDRITFEEFLRPLVETRTIVSYLRTSSAKQISSKTMCNSERRVPCKPTILLASLAQTLPSASGREVMHSRDSRGGIHDPRRTADECERLAESATLLFNRPALLSAAEMWRKVAADTRPRNGAGLDPALGELRNAT